MEYYSNSHLSSAEHTKNCQTVSSTSCHVDGSHVGGGVARPDPGAWLVRGRGWHGAGVTILLEDLLKYFPAGRTCIPRVLAQKLPRAGL